MFEPDYSRKLRAALAAAAFAPLLMCGRLGPGTGSPPEQPPLAQPSAEAAPPAHEALILQPESETPVPIQGRWKVAAGEHNCTLTLVVEHGDLSGETSGCAGAGQVRPIAIGVVSGGSFLFQTGRGGGDWIWSGRYDADSAVLQGRREHVLTGELESFVARR